MFDGLLLSALLAVIVLIIFKSFMSLLYSTLSRVAFHIDFRTD